MSLEDQPILRMAVMGTAVGLSLGAAAAAVLSHLFDRFRRTEKAWESTPE